MTLTRVHLETGLRLPIKAYKMVDPQFERAFLAGESIKIDSLENYRAMEGERGDPLEGAAKNYIGRTMVLDGMNPADVSLIRSIGIDISFCYKPSFTNISSVQSLQPMRIFCASLAPDFSKAKDMGCSLIEITDLLKFAATINRQNPHLGEVRWSPVEYVAREADLSISAPVRPHPFKKSQDFAWENEIRLLWGGPVNGSPIVRSPAVRRYLRKLA